MTSQAYHLVKSSKIIVLICCVEQMRHFALLPAEYIENKSNNNYNFDESLMLSYHILRVDNTILVLIRTVRALKHI